MSYTPFYINPMLTEAGYQKLFVQGVQVSIAEIALGAANGASGYATAFRDSRTALMDEKQRKQVGASQAEDATDDDGNPFRRIDYATMFTGNDNYDAWEIGFFDTDGDMIYVWSTTTGSAFVPVRINLDIAVLLAQYLTMQEEITNVTVVDSGYPFELFVGALTDSAAALIAAHEGRETAHQISQINGLQTELDAKLTEFQGDNLYVRLTQLGEQATDEEVAAAVLQHLQVSDPHPQYSKRFSASEPLPSVDIGVIWHDAYASLMSWVTLSSNGYEYSGYASINIGQVSHFDVAQTPAGWLKIDGSTIAGEFAALKAATGYGTLADGIDRYIRSDGGSFSRRDLLNATAFMPGLNAGSTGATLWIGYRNKDPSSNQAITWPNGFGYSNTATASVPAPFYDAMGAVVTRPKTLVLPSYIKY